MRARTLIVSVLALAGCAAKANDAQAVRIAQQQSRLGEVSTWHLDAGLNPGEVQRMRDRAYAFCEGRSDKTTCERDQDVSLLAYTNAFREVRLFRADPAPIFAFAQAHKRDPGAFDRIRHYCEGIYREQGEEDARSLGPCLSAGVGSDFFGIVAVD